MGRVPRRRVAATSAAATQAGVGITATRHGAGGAGFSWATREDGASGMDDTTTTAVSPLCVYVRPPKPSRGGRCGRGIRAAPPAGGVGHRIRGVAERKRTGLDGGDAAEVGLLFVEAGALFVCRIYGTGRCGPDRAAPSCQNQGELRREALRCVSEEAYLGYWGVTVGGMWLLFTPTTGRAVGGEGRPVDRCAWALGMHSGGEQQQQDQGEHQGELRGASSARSRAVRHVGRQV